MLKNILSLLLIVVFFACDTPVQQDATTTTTKDSIAIINLLAPLPINNEEAARIKFAAQKWFDTTLKINGFNGGIIVAKKGNIIFQAYNGSPTFPGIQPATSNTPMHIASVSKTFTAMAILKLWELGKLNIDEEVSKYFPNFNYTGVTIRTLLNHRSGLPNYVHFVNKTNWDENKFLTNEDVLQILVSQKNSLTDITPPNTHFSYCNTNYALLALIIEKVTGKKYATFLQETFFTPLQLKNTLVADTTNITKLLPSFDYKGRLVPLNFLDGVYGDKNIFTTPQDLLIWDRALNSTKLFTNETLKQAYLPYSNEKPGIKNYGLGWRMNSYPNGKKIIFHNGWWHGSNAVFMRLLNEDATIIVIGNKFTKSIYHAKVLANIFGDYYAPEEEEEQEGNKLNDSLMNKKNNFAPILLNKKQSKLEEFFKDKNKLNPTH
jgi:CubicO group peptidase (beta-lactamase class C family)